MKYLDPKNELAIQKVFGQNMQLCKSLINCLLPQSGSFHAQEVKILSNADTIVCPVFRNPSLAVECRGESGEPFMVLFQMMWTDGFLQSILFDADKAYIRYQNQVQFSEFSMPVVGIALVNDLFEYERDHYYHYFAAVEEAHSGNLVKDFSLIFVELPKVSLKQNEVNKKQHSWLNYFIHVGESMLDVPELLRGDDEIMAAVNLCNIDSCSEKEIFEYNKYKSVTDVKKGINNEAEARGFTPCKKYW